MLSPETYSVKRKFDVIKNMLHFGCCSMCSNQLRKVYNSTSYDKPKFSIANKKCFGYAPKILMDLNETEVALISIARVDRHLITLNGGVHTCIVGWHTLYYNGVEHTSKVLNYYDRCERNKIKDQSTLQNEKEYGNPIQVLLTGPFTREQKQIAKNRCSYLGGLLEASMLCAV